ncbi:envelope-like protein [Cucumis melo var. makuwa]|uniref:Envelope-like protein n=1 Tax=Cucumis melo var. makuwa TaxID=1194695 RepID=A0A5A7T252_CUCMM|nr:envelope-like protein [Cucumis melo var. makuwa]
MVNTRKGTYTDKSSEGVLEAPSPRAAVHGTRVRGRRFKSTPPWRPYKLPSKKSHVDIPTNSDDLDDVPLARLLKKVAAPDVFPEKFADPILSVHSQESSSSEGVFVPTPGLRQTSSVEPNPSHYSPPIQSPIPDNIASTDPYAAPVEHVVELVGNEDVVEPVDIDDHNDEQNRRNITTKIGRKKVPLNIPSVPIDGISFHLEESAGLSKTISDVGPFYPQLIREFVVNLPADFNDPSSPDYQIVHIRGLKFLISPTVINGFLGNALSNNFSPSSPSTDPTNGIPVVALSVKYTILHKIGIANWFPSSHASSVYVALGTFLYRICNDDRGSHVPDIDHDLHPSRGPRLFDTTNWDKATDRFFVDRELASKILNALTAESRSLSTAISLLLERRLEIDSLIRHLKTFAPSSSRGDPSSD